MTLGKDAAVAMQKLAVGVRIADRIRAALAKTKLTGRGHLEDKIPGLGHINDIEQHFTPHLPQYAPTKTERTRFANPAADPYIGDDSYLVDQWKRNQVGRRDMVARGGLPHAEEIDKTLLSGRHALVVRQTDPGPGSTAEPGFNPDRWVYKGSLGPGPGSGSHVRRDLAADVAQKFQKPGAAGRGLLGQRAREYRARLRGTSGVYTRF